MEEIEEIKLGTKVKDIVTGFEGIVTARVKYLSGCIQYCVETEIDKEGKMAKSHYIDVGQLLIVDEGIRKSVEELERNIMTEDLPRVPGGRMPNVPE